ncbi:MULTISPECIES: hypothetical protein [unclassified Streptomyces]|uniref:hypothetical protein n=1 Tax=unclassified Streptomyces TaxID=2593676 RepID=UPI000DBA5717|nr:MULTISPECIES: hypothetical protein [unclassified Streptomyces]MYT73657.1 hypothetical protein [Streptomyces sp. SID8367]RAJ85195.1 hypothetical protein K377_03676 [Streptomyces sp. PsTaAH-137]
MSVLRTGRPVKRTRIAKDRAEAALVAQYTALVRLAYLTLPAALSRHRRVLLAHGAAQRALPGARGTLVPRPRGPQDGDAVTGDALRVRVLRAALSAAHRPAGWPGALPPPRTLVPRLPVVWGLRLFPHAGGAEEIALGQALADAPAPTRAAFVLRRVDGLPDRRTAALLEAAGVPDAATSVRAAKALDKAAGAAAEALLCSQEFDACSVQSRPTDLVRRGRRKRAAWLAGATAVVALAAVIVPQATDGSGRPTTSARAAMPPYLSADRLVRTAPDQWADTSRVDFTAWPARGDRTDDKDLLSRALATWAEPTTDVRVTSTPGTPVDAPPRSPQLLYAGDLGGRGVVLFSDGDRLARYTDADGDKPAALDLARADDADVTTAAVVVLTRSKGSARYLTAPWVAESTTRDLLRPDSPAEPLHVSGDGVTDAVPVVAAGNCSKRPVLQLRSSSRIVEHHAFVVADLGGLSPVHLTYTPLPGHGTPPARQPREATSSQALLAWARGACRLGSWEGGAVSAVNAWDFAEQELPEGGGHAVWMCARASTWRGPGDVALLLRTPASSLTAPAELVGQARNTAACSRFGQHVVASTRWKSPKEHWYLVAAGSRAVVGISASGAVDTTRPGRTMAVRAPEDGTVRVTARLSAEAGGERLSEVGAEQR